MKSVKKFKDTWLSVLALIYSITLILVLIDSYFASGAHFIEFFTYLSNIFCAIWLLIYALTGFFKANKFSIFIRNKILVLTLNMAITITFLIVALWLFPIWKGDWIKNGISGGLFYTHFLTAVVMWLVFFYYQSTGKFNWKLNFFVLIYPLVYFVAIIVRQLIVKDKWYPYNFVDPSFYNNNYFIFAAVVVVLAGVFYGVSYLLWVIKSKLNKKTVI